MAVFTAEQYAEIEQMIATGYRNLELERERQQQEEKQAMEAAFQRWFSKKDGQ